jgi:hypothetical protein
VVLAGPEMRRGILTISRAPGELPEAAEEVPAVQGSFDCGTASLREAVPPLRMTNRISVTRSQDLPEVCSMVKQSAVRTLCCLPQEAG